MATDVAASDLVPEHEDISLPDPPSPSFFTEAQWKTWWALMDTVIPSVGPKIEGADGRLEISSTLLEGYYDAFKSKSNAPPSQADFEAYLSEKPSENEAFRAHIYRTMAGLPKEMRGQLESAVNLLGSRFGSLMISGYMTPFCDLSADAREKVIQSWQASYFSSFHSLAKSICQIATNHWVMTSPLFRSLSGWKDFPDGYKKGQAADYTFKQFEAGDEPHVIETDVVIVGSGCGGGVCAEVLAKAGHRVLVVEKGYYFPPAQLPMKQDTGGYYLFDGNGIVTSDDGSLSIMSGSTWGGGGAVNWGVSLQTPQYVRQEWSKKRGLSVFETQEFQDSLDRVCEFMGVSDDTVRQNHRGQVLLDGSKKLGYKAKVTPHNNGNKDHHCGQCHLGCGSAGKKGPAVSWLPAAAKDGAEFIEGFQVDKVTFDDFASGKKASGIKGRWVSRDADGSVSGPMEKRVTRDVEIKAKRVIISGGSLWSPVILQKSGLANPQIGRNLAMHPVTIICAYWKEDANPWEGCAISSVVTTFEDLDNEGNGTKLEGLCMVPSIVIPQMKWRSGIDFKMSALRYRNMNAFFSMPRDKETGHIYTDSTSGRPRIVYTPGPFDRANALEGVIGLLKICFTEGAEEIRPSIKGINPFVRSAGEDDKLEEARFEKWLGQIRASGISATDGWGCAHQMGSNRMSKSPEDGVVDSKGKVWGVEGLYVADASVFPTATGVNPMVTTMAIANLIAKGIATDLDSMGA
ncbi:GMC oxidoreductase [Pestalotiopsis sp. NC0098]|nr:GMC oxidoreductase [Pestalotiopsis sp. NC0098]